MREAPWYEHWFGSEYLELYAHRDRREARRAVALVERVLVERGGRDDLPVLDLACGAGRHLEELVRRERRSIGLDLSPELLAHARGSLPAAPLVRGDMGAIPLASGSAGAVTSFFTSFGYFHRPEDDERVLAEVRRVLAPGGIFVLDFLNAHHVRDSLRPRDERRVRGIRVVEERRLVEEGRRVEKRIALGEPGSDGFREFIERVRLYEPEELTRALEGVGLEPLDRFGDYHGSSFTVDSERLILVAGRDAGPRRDAEPARRLS